MPGILGGGTAQAAQPNVLQQFFTPKRTLAFQGLGDILRGGTGDKYLQGLINLQRQQAGQKLWDETFGRGAAAPAGAQAAPTGGFIAPALAGPAVVDQPRPSTEVQAQPLDRSMSLIREFESFSETPYEDVDALRAGYGSDTTTTAAGDVLPVTAETRVTRRDAERDLMRRLSTEFRPRARQAVTPQIYDNLGPNQQAVLDSITYNYGSLPERVASVARTGDIMATSQAIAGLAGDNEGINRARRQREAALFAEGNGARQPMAAPTLGQAAAQLQQPPAQRAGQQALQQGRAAPRISFNRMADILASTGIDPARKQFALNEYNRQTQPQEFKFLQGADGFYYRVDPYGKIPPQRAIPEAERVPETTAAQRDYLYSRNQGYQGSFTEYKQDLARAGSGVPDPLRAQLAKKTGEQWSKYIDAGVTASAAQSDLAVLSELARAAPQGPLVGRLAARFPEFSNNAAAFQSIIKRMAPQFRVPGSGATSDIEYQGMLDSLPALLNRPEANQLIIQTLSSKLALDQERADIVRSYQNNVLTEQEARNALVEIDRRSILTPEMKAMIGTMQGPTQSSTTSGGFNWSVN